MSLRPYCWEARHPSSVLRAAALRFTYVCVLLLRTPIGLAAVRWAACEVSALLGYARVGAVFVFGAEAVASTWALRVPTG